MHLHKFAVVLSVVLLAAACGGGGPTGPDNPNGGQPSQTLAEFWYGSPTCTSGCVPGQLLAPMEGNPQALTQTFRVKANGVPDGASQSYRLYPVVENTGIPGRRINGTFRASDESIFMNGTSRTFSMDIGSAPTGSTRVGQAGLYFDQPGEFEVYVEMTESGSDIPATTVSRTIKIQALP